MSPPMERVQVGNQDRYQDWKQAPRCREVRIAASCREGRCRSHIHNTGPEPVPWQVLVSLGYLILLQFMHDGNHSCYKLGLWRRAWRETCYYLHSTAPDGDHIGFHRTQVFCGSADPHIPHSLPGAQQPPLIPFASLSVGTAHLCGFNEAARLGPEDQVLTT